MKKKGLLWSVIVVLALAAAYGGYWWLSRPQIVVLDDGSRLALLAVTYGKHHKFPGATVNGHKVRSGRLDTDNNSICLWIDQKHKRNQWPNYQMLVFDAANTACCGSYTMSYGDMGGNSQTEQVVGIAFEAFPRHSRKLYFRLQQWGRNGQKISPVAFVVRNPAPRDGYEKWTAEALPDVREDGDLQVTLTRCELAKNAFSYGRREKEADKDPLSSGVLAAFHVEQNGQVVTNWQVVEIQTFDATGNHARNWSWSNHEEDQDQVMTYQWGLWPDEPAWKLKVEMSRKSGFNADEVWTVPDVPLKPGKMNDTYQRDRRGEPFAAKTMGDNTLKVFPGIRLSGDEGKHFYGGMDAVVLIDVDPPPDGFRMTVVKITDDQGHPIEFQDWGWGSGEFRFALKKLGDAKTVNITLALHRSRYFEYTVKPSKS